METATDTSMPTRKNAKSEMNGEILAEKLRPEKLSVLVFDIETVSTRKPELIDAIAREAIEKRPAKNAAKDIKTHWDTSEARALRGSEAVAKTAMDPMLAEVIIVAYEADGMTVCYDGLPRAGMADNPTEVYEREHGLLVQCAQDWDAIVGPETVWVGHNIEGFDLPVLLNAFRRHDIEPPEWFPRFRGGRWSGRVYDTMKQIPNNRAGFVSLDAASQALGLPPAKSVTWKGESMTGARVGEAYDEGATELLREYCQADVDAESALFRRLTFGGSYGLRRDDEDLRAALGEIRASEAMTTAGKKAAMFDVLYSYGRVPAGVLP